MIQLPAMINSPAANRRAFLRFLAGSPLLSRAWAQQSASSSGAKDIISVMDFEDLAHKALPPAHWGYMASGVDDDLTLRANVAAFGKIELRPRRLVDGSAGRRAWRSAAQ